MAEHDDVPLRRAIEAATRLPFAEPPGPDVVEWARREAIAELRRRGEE